MEEKAKELSIVAVISILTIVLATSAGIASEGMLAQTSNVSGNGSEGAVDQAKIGDILANPAKYMREPVTVTGEYKGWQGEGYEPPVTRSDWVIKDKTGLIYVTGKSPGLDPVEDIGKKLEVTGYITGYSQSKRYCHVNENKDTRLIFPKAWLEKVHKSPHAHLLQHNKSR